METLESSRVCRLCGQHSGISINIFDENENHIRKINAVLPIMVHEMDLLPKQMCHRCSYKLEEFHKFYVNCLKTDAALKSQLSWMRKSRGREKIGVPMVHIENVKIKAEPLDYDVFDLEPLVENIDYINSMGPVAFPADGIHDELTYATFSRCQCYCDKDQSRSGRTAAEFCRDYEESVSRCGKIADNSRKRTLKNTRLRPILRKTLLPGCLQKRSSHVNVADARDRLATVIGLKNDVSSLETHNCLRGRSVTVAENPTASKSTIVRNLRPRRNLVDYASVKKRTSSVNPRPASKSDVPTSTMRLALDFEPTRQIKEEQLEEFEGRRTLRPRRNLVDYHGPKKRKFSEYRGETCEVFKNTFPLCPAKKRTQRCSEKPSKHESAPDILNLKVKQEALDDLEDAMLNEATGAASRLSGTTVAGFPAKTEPPTGDVDPRDDTTDYFKFQLAKGKSLSNIVRNRLARTKKVCRLPGANYSPKCLRSQDTYLRNGKPRKSDHAKWSVKRPQTKKLMDAVAKRAKKVPPTVLKLAESIKHYCDTCNVSFINKELFRLHTCYYD
ncbi:uncharacterized protein [Linepithema humile]|uniref:uncharacterized protein n=1 Tax=Linepithema humile TaxID=83485 RepID=UPI000623939B|nr:PREDICTED: uncharacterized protein LOC105671384 [Linepithema humile]